MGEVVGKDGLLYCNVCGEKTERIINFPLLDGTGKTESRKVRRKCRCKREEIEAYEKRLKYEEDQRKINELRKLSLMDSKLKGIKFENFKKTKDNEHAYRIARNYVMKFDDMYEKNQGLLFWGNVGTGKSYAAAMIANELLERQYSVIMTSFVKLLDELGPYDKDVSDYINKLNRAKLLIIDDLGTERGTDYALERVYDIIDSRYRSGKPIILTTNLTIKEMQECEDIRYNRIYDRIYEMCYPVQIQGLSWRKKDAAKRFDEMKSILEG